MAEEDETPGGEPPAGSQAGGLGSEGRARRSEGDLLAERRARRAAESGEHALTLRAEAAEATVRTLETHVSSLQQRLREAEEERKRVSELIEAERSSLASGLGSETWTGHTVHGTGTESVLERELRRVKQREYAEQRLRAEAEDQLVDLERESQAEIDRLSRHLAESHLDARSLAARLESVQRELAEAEEAAAAERADLRSVAARQAESLLQARVTELEQRALEAQRNLDAERTTRERTERLLESMRRGHRNVEALVVELKGVVARLKATAATPPVPPPPRAQNAPRAPEAPGRQEISPREEPRSEDAPSVQSAPTREPSAPEGASPQPGRATQPGAPVQAENGEMVDALAAAVERLRARAEEHTELPPPAPAVGPPTHKHSMSLITRLRIARKQRRER